MTFESALAKRRNELIREINNINTTKARKEIATKQLAIVERDMGRLSIEIKEETNNKETVLTYPTY